MDDDFKKAAKLVEIIEVPYVNPALVFKRFVQSDWSVLLQTADPQNTVKNTGDYSYIIVWPFKKIELRKSGLWEDGEYQGEQNLFNYLKLSGKNFNVKACEGFPPFQGGMAGFLAYELCEVLHNIPSVAESDSDPLLAAVGFYDLVHSFDHRQQKSWVIASSQQAQKVKLKKYLNHFNQPLKKVKKRNPSNLQITANFSREEYVQAINRAIEYIRDGDIFEVNLSQQFAVTKPKEFCTYQLYEDLIQINPNPFSAYAKYEETVIVSSSPERFLQVRDRVLEARPIKGTRKRGSSPKEDLLLAQELLKSEKERAENIMIVDLMRNDISRVCTSDSVRVTQLCGHEVYPNVHHLVSVISGELDNESSVFDLFSHAFPGGSITGAPKIRAMQIISELEKNTRGPYCGNLFWCSFDGKNLDSSILIRTYCINNDIIKFNGGGAITINSNPIAEYEETLSKVAGLKSALQGSRK